MSDTNTPTPESTPSPSDSVRYIVQRPIKHSGKDLAIGEVVLFKPAQAQALLADGALKPEITTPTEGVDAVDLTKVPTTAPLPDPNAKAKK